MRASRRLRQCCSQLLHCAARAPPPPPQRLAAAQRRVGSSPKAPAAAEAPKPPPAGEKGRAGAHSAEFFYHPERDPDLALAAQDPYGSRLRRFLLPVCSVAIVLYVGVFAVPLVSGGSVTHASTLLRAREPFLQRSGCDRLALLLRGGDALAAAAVQHGATHALLALLDSPDAGVRAAPAAALAALAATPSGADALRAAPELLSLQALAASKPRSGEASEQAAARAAARDALVTLGLITAFAQR